MRNLKKALALAVASVMLLGMMVVGTGATFTDVDAKDNVEAIEVLEAVEVMIGDNGKFNPDKAVTRNEFAVIMTNLLGLDTDDYSGTTPFTDVPAWAEPFVAACYAHGIVSGTSATTYGGEGGVTATQAGLMVMKALGYFQYATDFGSDWQLATVKQADKIDLFDGIDAKVTATLTRNEAAQLVLNALVSTMVEAEEDGIGLDANGNLASKYDYVAVLATNGSADKIANETITVQGTDYDAVQLGEELFENKLALIPTQTDIAGRPAHTWKLGVNEIGTYADDFDYTAVVTGTKNDTLPELLDTISKDLIMDANCSTIVNNDRMLSTALQIGDVVELYNTNPLVDDDIDVIVIIRYSTAEITDVDTDVNAADAADGVSAYITLDDLYTYNDTDIVGFDAKTYVEDAIVAIAKDGDGEIIGSYIPTAVEGAITAYTTTATYNTYTLGGTKYTFTGTVDNNMGTIDLKEGVYKLYLDTNGFVLRADIVEGNVTLNDVVYLANGWSDFTYVYGAPKYKFYAQVVDMNGVVAEIEISEAQFAGVKAVTLTTADTTTNWSTVRDSLFVLNGDGTTTAAASYDHDAGAGTYSAGDYVSTVTYYEADATLDSVGGANQALDTNRLYTYTTNTKGVSTLTAWTNATDDDFDVAYDAADGSTADLKSTSKFIDLANGKFYVNASTKFIVVEDSLADVDVTVKTGSISYDLTSGDDVYVIYDTVNGSDIAAYVIIPTTAYSAAADGDYLYVNDASEKTTVTGGEKITVYKMDGTTIEIVVEAGLTSTDNMFYTYSIDADGYYTLVSAAADGANELVDDVTYASYVSSLVTAGGQTYNLADADVSKAIFVDLHSKTATGAFTKTIATLADMEAAADKGYTVRFDAMLTDAHVGDATDKVAIIFVYEANYPSVTVAAVDGLGCGYSDTLNHTGYRADRTGVTARFVLDELFTVAAGKTVMVLKSGDTVLAKAVLQGAWNPTNIGGTEYMTVGCTFTTNTHDSSSWEGESFEADAAMKPDSVELYLNGVLVAKHNVTLTNSQWTAVVNANGDPCTCGAH